MFSMSDVGSLQHFAIIFPTFSVLMALKSLSDVAKTPLAFAKIAQ